MKLSETHLGICLFLFVYFSFVGADQNVKVAKRR